ncbi:DUF4124 domain-containing protein [Noviherbaspirillum sp. Root189]|uniref:DUF4124 domain-containing protein n=1 Tax=Noviherbaspirillum sp. Root189 TaxID=1736487 RepID=UPI0012E362F4|nr:DUF4124 domain-containing protein [Noviherbaspirillum sp. Root189]
MRTYFLCGSLVASLLCISMPAYAIYRCEASGKISYSDMPCPGARQLEIRDSQIDSPASGEKQHIENKKALEKVENARHRETKTQYKAQQRAAKQRAALDKKCATLSRRQQYASDDVRTAPQKSVEKARRKASRITEQYEAECKARRSELLAS